MRGDHHRLRDLGRGGQIAAGLVALALLLAPVMAFVHFLGDWSPMNDNAFMGLRAYDVGTPRTPLTGQPSFASYYGEDEHVDHIGPLHYYLLAPFVRALGASVGMPLVSLLISGAAALASTWVVFRQLGPRAGMAAGVVMALVMFTTGAGSLLNPVSSAVAGYPLFASAVLVWALLCGDDRLLLLATGVGSFAVQMHLSVGPTMALLGAVALAGVAATWWRASVVGDDARCQRVRRAAVASAVLGAVLWAPVALQQLFGGRPNLSALARYAADSGVEAAGGLSGLRQIVNVLGWPPLLGRTEVTGFDLLATPGRVTWTSAVVVLVVLGWGGARWWQAARPGRTGTREAGAVGGEDAGDVEAGRRALLVVMVGVLVVAGYLNGSRVPLGLEEGRLVFYHWIWPLSFFTALTLVLLAIELAGPAAGGLGRPVAGGAVAAMALLAVVGVQLDRPSNTLVAMSSSQPRQVYESLADQVAEHRQEIRSPALLVTGGQMLIGEHHSALALELEERGIPVVHGPRQKGFVAGDRMADDDVASLLVLVIHRSPDWPDERASYPGREVASHDLLPGFDRENYWGLVRELEAAGEEGRLGTEAEEHLVELFGPEMTKLIEWGMVSLDDNPAASLLNAAVVRALLEHPLPEVDLDPARMRRLLDDLEGSPSAVAPIEGSVFAMKVMLVTGDEVRELDDPGVPLATSES